MERMIYLDVLVEDNASKWSPEGKAHILSLLKKEALIITFIKLDDTERVMKCTLCPEEMGEFAGLIDFDREVQDVNTSAFNVFDLERNQWRRIRWDSIINIRGTE
jgi:hypothetical protein